MLQDEVLQKIHGSDYPLVIGMFILNGISEGDLPKGFTLRYTLNIQNMKIIKK